MAMLGAMVPPWARKHVIKEARPLRPREITELKDIRHLISREIGEHNSEDENVSFDELKGFVEESGYLYQSLKDIGCLLGIKFPEGKGKREHRLEIKSETLAFIRDLLKLLGVKKEGDTCFDDQGRVINSRVAIKQKIEELIKNQIPTSVKK